MTLGLSSTRARVLVGVGLVLLSLSLIDCARTRGRRKPPEQSGFLGDYSQLKENPNYKAAEIYVNENAVWSRYDSVHIDSVTLWVNKDTGALKDEEKQLLTDIVYTALHEKIGKYIQIVDTPGPRTIRLRAALTQAKGANVPLRTITTVVPQLRLLGMLASAPTDVAYTVGTATVEIDLRDSITGERLAAALDTRAGAKGLPDGAMFKKWSDVQAAAELWAERVAFQLVRHGVRRKPGAEMPEEPKA